MAGFPQGPQSRTGHKQDSFHVVRSLHPGRAPGRCEKDPGAGRGKGDQEPGVEGKIERMKLVVEYKAPADMKKKVIEEYAAALEIANKVGLLKK